MIQYRFKSSVWCWAIRICIVACWAAAFSEARATGFSADGSEYVIYDDTTTWTVKPKTNGKVDLNHTANVKAGQKALLVDGGTEFIAPEPISATGFDRIEFWAHGGKFGLGANRAYFNLEGNTATYGRLQRYMRIACDRWEKYSIPLRYLGNPSAITSLTWTFDGWQSPICLDEIKLVRGPSETYLPQPKFPELLVDGGFENGANGQYNMGAKIESVTSPVHSGKYALRVYDRPLGKNLGWTGPDFEPTPYYHLFGTGWYEVQAWFRLPDGVTRKARCQIGLEIIYSDPADNKHGRHANEGSYSAEVGTEWTQVKFKTLIKTGKWITVMKLLPTADGDTVEYFVDDVSMRKIPAPDGSDKGEAKVVLTHVPVQGETLRDISKQFKVSVLGQAGNQAGEFRYPCGVICAADGTIWVVDTDNHRLQKMTAPGKWEVLGKKGSADGEFLYPRTLTLGEKGTIFVNDHGNNRLVKFSDGTWKTLWKGPKYDFKGWMVLDPHVPLTVEGLAYTPAYGLMVVDLWHCRLWNTKTPDVWGVLSSQEKTERHGTVTYGLSPGLSDLPQGVAVDAKGNIYLADTGNHRIQKFDAATGKWEVLAGISPESVRCFAPETTGAGDQPGQFNLPKAVAVDAQGNIYVADSGNNRIQMRVADTGQWLAIGSLGSADGSKGTIQFNGPQGVAVDAQGTLYVADTRNHRIVTLSR